jgi:hypothetical protein
MIRVSQAQAAHFLLQKNYLTDTKAADLAQLIERLVGLPTQPGETLWLAGLTRLSPHKPTQFMPQLYQSQSLIKSYLMRGAGYLVWVERYPSWYAATLRQRNQAFHSEFRLWGVDQAETEQLEKAVLAVLDEQPATVETIVERLPPGVVKQLTQTSRGGQVKTVGNVALMLHWLAAKGILAEKMVANVSSLWPALAIPDKQVTYAPLNYWYPQLDLSTAPGEAEAQAELVWAYLAAFGPVTEADISFWTGFGKSETARAIGALAGKSTLVMVEGIPGMLLLLKAQAEALAATSPPSQPIINILPADDPFTTAHRASRSRYFTDQTRQRQVFSNSGAAQPTIVVNGQIVGTWDWLPAENKVAWRLLTPIDPALQPLVEAEIGKVGMSLSNF